MHRYRNGHRVEYILEALQSASDYRDPSAEKERVLTNVKGGGVKCIVLRRRRQVRESERESVGNSGIDSSPSYPYCLWAHVGWTCWTPTERPADRDKDKEGGSGKAGYFSYWLYKQQKRRADKDRAALSLSVCFFLSQRLACIREYHRPTVIPPAYTLIQIMMHSIAHKHLWPPCLQTSSGISWDWVRKEKCILLLLLSAPPLTSSLHSCSYLFLPIPRFYCTDMTSSALLLRQDKEETGTLLFVALNSPVPFLLFFAFSPLSYSLATLAHNNKIPSAAISHQLHAWGVASQPSPRNKDTQSVVVGTAVCQSHLHSMAFQPARFKRSSEGELLSRSGVHPDVEGEAQNMCGGGYLWKSPAAQKLVRKLKHTRSECMVGISSWLGRRACQWSSMIYPTNVTFKHIFIFLVISLVLHKALGQHPFQ